MSGGRGPVAAHSSREGRLGDRCARLVASTAMGCIPGQRFSSRPFLFLAKSHHPVRSRARSCCSLGWRAHHRRNCRRTSPVRFTISRRRRCSLSVRPQFELVPYLPIYTRNPPPQVGGVWGCPGLEVVGGSISSGQQDDHERLLRARVLIHRLAAARSVLRSPYVVIPLQQGCLAEIRNQLAWPALNSRH